LRSYGFETFDQCWDESYDTIVDPLQRLEAVIELMKNYKNYDIAQARAVAQRNRQQFFSENFWQQVVSEFETNFAGAIESMEQSRSGAYFLRHYRAQPKIKKQIPPEIYNYVQKLMANDNE
jgi:hypothetical protein